MRTIIFFLVQLLIPIIVFAQVDKTSELFKTLRIRDSLLFNVGFNTCDISQFESLISDNFEFYHDKSGITSSKSAFVASIKDGLCKLSYKPRRELVEESLEVYPLENNGALYGAIQMGKHRFYAIEKNKPEYFTSIAKFTHVWKIENGTWKLIKGLSYDHQEKNGEEKGAAIFENETVIQSWLIENKIPALGIGIINEGKLQQVKVYGELQKGETAPFNTIFNVASLTKPITAMLTLKLVSMGKWNLDEPIYKYWTDQDIANDPRHKKLTTRHILSHQTGFPNWRWNNKSKKLAFEFDPGSKYQYSGEGFEYLRRALEKKFSTTLDKLTDSLLFKPLKMTDTRFFWDLTTDESRFALWYDAKGNVYETYKNTSANGADDLLTTVEDYGKFLIAVMHGDGISKEVFNEMITYQVKTKENKYFGLGFEIYDFGNGEYALSHGGADKGVQTIVFLFPKSNQGLIIFTNVDDGYKIYEKLLNTYLGEYGRRIFEIEMRK
jgi:CubicO group peptidase (beta-lactamase class C family)